MIRFTPRPAAASTARAARLVNAALGVVLLVSGVLSLHGAPLGTITAVLGIAIVVFALVALQVPAARFGSLIAGCILFVATIGMRKSTAVGAWINVAASILVVTTALIPARERSPLAPTTS